MPSPNPGPGPPSTSTGTIVGAVFGVIAGIGLLAAVVFFLLRRRKGRPLLSAAKRPPPESLENTSLIAQADSSIFSPPLPPPIEMRAATTRALAVGSSSMGSRGFPGPEKDAGERDSMLSDDATQYSFGEGAAPSGGIRRKPVPFLGPPAAGGLSRAQSVLSDISVALSTTDSGEVDDIHVVGLRR